MIKATLGFLELLYSTTPMLLSLIVYTLLALRLAKSIKKHDTIYYWGFAILSFAYLIPFLFRIFGAPLPINLGAVPFLGESLQEISSAAYFVHPVLILIMYMGAFSPKIPPIKRLMSIRKELSIIVGFPVLAHSIKRIFASFPSGWQYFFDHDTYMQSPRVHSALGSGITSFVFLLGLVMTLLFLVLWITSFDSVHRRMGAKRWKHVQKWSYGLYAMLFIHAMGLQVGGLINHYARAEAEALKAQREVVERAPHAPTTNHTATAQAPAQAHPAQGAPQQSTPAQREVQPSQSAPVQATPSQGHGHGSRPKTFSFSDVEPSRVLKQWINIFILISIYGSYLYFRVRKARRARQKRTA